MCFRCKQEWFAAHPKSELAKTGHIAQVTWRLLISKIGAADLQDTSLSLWQHGDRVFLSLLPEESMLGQVRRTSSTCTGAFTSEMAVALIQKTVNDSKALQVGIFFRPTIAYAAASVKDF